MSDMIDAVNFGNGIVGVIEYDSGPINPREDENTATLACWHSRYTLGDSGAGGWGKGQRYTRFDAKEFKEKLLGECGFARDIVDESDFLDEEGNFDEDKYEEVWQERADALIEQNCVVLPLYLFEHSEISISVSGFSCPWDSGQVGYAYITLAKAQECWGTSLGLKDVPNFKSQEGSNVKTLWELATERIKSEVDAYDAYLRGEAYAYIIYDFTLPLQEGKVSEEDLESPESLDFELAEELDSCWGYLEDIPYVKSEMAEAAKHILEQKPEQLKLEL